ncbi:DUF2188 domain-containing protein [Microbacterium radiodurans]|nr:DUF2188 domain-containing protein [Microbacterium radiodurans]
MPKGDVETFCDDGVWRNRIVGGGTFVERFARRSDALAAAREIARERRVAHSVRTQDPPS